MYPAGPAARRCASADVPVYAEVEHAGRALARLAAARSGCRGGPRLPAPAPAALDDAYATARALLSTGGISFVAQRTVTSADGALAAAAAIGYPVVLKALHQLHKSDAGGVVLAIAGEPELRAAVIDVRCGCPRRPARWRRWRTSPTASSC